MRHDCLKKDTIWAARNTKRTKIMQLNNTTSPGMCTSRYVTSHPGQLSLALPSWVGAMSTSQRALTPCGWGVKAGMVRVCVAGKTVWSPCYTCAISEHFRDKELVYRALYKFAFFTLLYFTLTSYNWEANLAKYNVGISLICEWRRHFTWLVVGSFRWTSQSAH